ncbi:MAG: hypothetical protein ACRDHD_09410, partial [Candidatus Limnocylindria bacterium]
PLASVAASPGAAGATPAGADEKARRRAESQERAALMAQLPAEVKLRVAKKEIGLDQALTDAGLPIPEWLRTGASAPAPAAVPPGGAQTSAEGADKEAKRAEAQRKLALMQQLPSDLKLRVAKREISLPDALREAGIDPEASG